MAYHQQLWVRRGGTWSRGSEARAQRDEIWRRKYEEQQAQNWQWMQLKKISKTQIDVSTVLELRTLDKKYGWKITDLGSLERQYKERIFHENLYGFFDPVRNRHPIEDYIYL